MFKLLKAFLKIYSELRRIREILEIIFKDKLEYYELYMKNKKFVSLSKQDSEIETDYHIKHDEYDKEIDPFVENKR